MEQFKVENQIENLNQDRLIRFQNLTTELTDLLGSQRIPVVAHNERGLNRYAVLPTDIQEKIFQDLSDFKRICEFAVAEQIPFEDNNKSIVWWLLSRLGLIPPSDLMNHIQPGMSIEVYNAENIQVFRTFDIVRRVSYSFSELVTHEWWELFGRSPIVTQGMINMVQGLVSGEIKGVHYTNFPVHEVREILNDEKYSTTMKHIFVCPLKDKQGNYAGGLSAFQMF